MFNDQIKLLEITRYELYLSTIKEHEKAKGLTIRAIALRMKRCPSIISRELKRCSLLLLLKMTIT